jgi:hypothetical protein
MLWIIVLLLFGFFSAHGQEVKMGEGDHWENNAKTRVVDPDPDWIRIQWLCGSGSGLDPDSVTLWIRIRMGNPDPGSSGKKIKKFQWKNGLFNYFLKILPLKMYKISPTTFWRKKTMNNTGIFDLIWLKF